MLFYSKNVGPVSMSLFGAACMKGVRFDFVECRVGANAMDFQLVTELGRLIAIHPEEHFVILSKDCGYDVVVRYWQDRGIYIKREPLFVNTPERTVQHEYEARLSGLGLMGKELYVAADILMRAMQLPQSERKITAYNSFQKHYGAKEGQDQYRVVKDLVKDLTMHGPFPPVKGAPSTRQETKQDSAAAEPGKTPEAHGPVKAQPAETRDAVTSERKKPSVVVKERCPTLTKKDTIVVTNAINYANQRGGSERVYKQQLMEKFKRSETESILNRTRDLLHQVQ